MELDILLFLANNPLYDTASEIVEIRYLSKSQVSSSVKNLEAKGYLRREYAGGNRKTAHLKIHDDALAIIADGRAAQEKFVEVMFRGISGEEAELMQRCNERIRRNVDQYLKEEMEECTSF
jgi:MarR family transcriptional regulator for hemolysin